MIPGMNPQMIKQAMKKLGIKQEEIPASEVIIKTPEKNIVISNPSVTKINMQGQETFQIVGKISEESPISEEDIETVSRQANVSKEKARKALEKSNGDLAEAILSLKQ